MTPRWSGFGTPVTRLSHGGVTSPHFPHGRTNDSILQERRHRQQTMIMELARQRQMEKEERQQRRKQQQLVQDQQEQEKFFASRHNVHDIMATVMPEISVSQHYDPPPMTMSTPNNGREHYFALHSRAENTSNHDDDFEMYDDAMDDNDSTIMTTASNDEMNDSVEMSGFGAQNVASNIEPRTITNTPMKASMGKARNYKLKSILRKRGTGQISRSEDVDNDDVTGSVAKKRVVFQDHVDEIHRSPSSVTPSTSSEYRRTRDHIATPIIIRKQSKSMRRQTEPRSAGSTRLRQSTKKGMFKSPPLSYRQAKTEINQHASSHVQDILTSNSNSASQQVTCNVPIFDDTISSISHEAGEVKKQIKAGRIGFSTPKSHRIQKVFLMHGEDIGAREARATEILSTAARRKYEESDTNTMRETYTNSTAETKPSTAEFSLSSSSTGGTDSSNRNELPPSSSGEKATNRGSENKFSISSSSSPSVGSTGTSTLTTLQPPALASSNGDQKEKSEKCASSTTNVSDIGFGSISSPKQVNGGAPLFSTSTRLSENGDQPQGFSLGTTTKSSTISTKMEKNSDFHSSANGINDNNRDQAAQNSFGTIPSFNPSATNASSAASSTIKGDAKLSVDHETKSNGFSISSQTPSVQAAKTEFSFGGTQMKTPVAANNSDTNSIPSFTFGADKDSNSASTRFIFNQSKAAAPNAATPASGFGFGSKNTNSNEASLKVGTSNGDGSIFGANFTVPSSKNSSSTGIISGRDGDASLSKIGAPGTFGSTGFSAPSNTFRIGTAVSTKGTIEATSFSGNAIGSSNSTTSTVFGQTAFEPPPSTFSFGGGNTLGSPGFNAPAFGQNNSLTTKSTNNGEANRKIIKARARKRG